MNCTEEDFVNMKGGMSVNNLLVVGDIHGDIFVLNQIIKMFPSHHLIFLGDFLDSFVFSPEQQIECLTVILKGIEEGKMTSIYGNHEMSYISPEFRCSGFNSKTNHMFKHLRSQVVEHFKSHLWYPQWNLLITHAGMTQPLWDHYHLTPDTVNATLHDWFKRPNTPFHWVGNRRGGFNKIGGPLWCDYYDEFHAIKEIRQIFGHSIVDHVTSDAKKRNWNIDCLQKSHGVVSINDSGDIHVISL